MIRKIEAVGLFGLGVITKNPDNMTWGQAIIAVVKAAVVGVTKHFSKTENSNPLSKLIRPVFERPTIKSIVGAQLAVLTVVAGVASVPASALGVVPADWQEFQETIEVEVRTDEGLTYPVPEAIGVSQGYHVLHAGIDIRSPKGSPVKPITAGVVSLVASQKTGWGHRVEIDHGNGVVSLYAHLGKMFVEEGDEVKPETVIGEIGLTGRTTGYHLHLEVFEDGKHVNPVKYLRKTE